MTHATNTSRQPRIVRWLTATALANAALLLVLSWFVFEPLVHTASRAGAPESLFRLLLPEFDYQPWHALAIQDGRTKPFETACGEVMRQITGRTKLEKQDPVAVVLSWMLHEEDTRKAAADWEHYPFILCDHHGLRREIFHHRLGQSSGPALSDSELHGKYVSPAELRESPGFDALLLSASILRTDLQKKAHLKMTREQLKAEEVSRRLMLFDTLCGRDVTRLKTNLILDEKFVNVAEFAEVKELSLDDARAALEKSATGSSDPFHIVGLDRVPGSGWFSLAQLRRLQREPATWREFMDQRLAERPQHYVAPERRKTLLAFQQQLQAGKGPESLEQVTAALHERREMRLKEFDAVYQSGDRDRTNRLLQEILRTDTNRDRFLAAREKIVATQVSDDAIHGASLDALRRILADADEQVVARVKQGIARAGRGSYDPDAAEFGPLHLDFLECLFPDLYRESTAANPFPDEAVSDVLDQFAAVRKAFREGQSAQLANDSEKLRETNDRRFQTISSAMHFKEASHKFFATLQNTTDELLAHGANGPIASPYPGTSTIPTELLFNRSQPFLWAWLTMFVAAALFLMSLGTSNRFIYSTAFVFYFASLAVQTFGFVLRVSIARRAPVANMYETVIFVAFMSAIFAFVLEAIYRRKVIALAGAMVATLGLILADQVPLALDPKISPMVPVLRTNFWLTVHVLTIVASYAGGTLAWGLGNISIGLLAFSRPNRDTLRTLSQFTYRAMQIAVLLLAAGTFLGGCWAAESWGRFWGWDPKEVGALIALVCYVIPLHARYIGWVKDFGLAVSAVLCYASIVLSWYVINFLLAAGLHSYGFSAGGGPAVLWACVLNLEWVLIASLIYLSKQPATGDVGSVEQPSLAEVS